MTPTLEDRLNEWLKQPGAFLTPAEHRFIDDMRRAARAGVGYGWMAQIIGWEWERVSSEMGFPPPPKGGEK